MQATMGPYIIALLRLLKYPTIGIQHVQANDDRF